MGKHGEDGYFRLKHTHTHTHTHKRLSQKKSGAADSKARYNLQGEEQIRKDLRFMLRTLNCV